MTLKRAEERAPRQEEEEEEAQWPVLESGKSLVDFNMRRKYGNYLDDAPLFFLPVECEVEVEEEREEAISDASGDAHFLVWKTKGFLSASVGKVGGGEVARLKNGR